MFKRVVLPIFLSLLLVLMAQKTSACSPVATSTAGPGITSVTTKLADYPDAEIPRYELFEITFTLDTSYENPFDPDEIIVDGHFITPRNSTLIQPGFYYQDYTVSVVNGRESYTPTDDSVWKVRFTPSEAGTYRYSLEVTDRNGTTNSETWTFEVINSSNPGFIRVSEANSRYFEFDNSRPFIGLGLNVAWWQAENRRISTYEYYLTRMNEYKVNLARVWMTNSGKDQNWILSIQDQQLGSDYNLEEAWAFDRILDMAQQQGVYFLLTLDDVNQYTYNWPDNLYNSALGGPCEYRSEIFTSAGAMQYQKQIFRYILARWGYSANILSWELFNEIDELEWSDPGNWNRQDMINWHQEMAQYLKSIDAHQHLVNTSTGSFKTHPDLYGLPEMDFAQIHFYYVPGCCDYAPSDPAGRDMADLTRYYAHEVYSSVSDKPSIIGEWGLLNEVWNPSPNLDSDDQGVHLHNGLWASLMSGTATTGLNWHWGYHQVHDPSWWVHYNALANYFEYIHITDLSVMKPVNVDFSLPSGSDERPEAFASTNDNLRVMGLRNGNAVCAWIQNTASTWWKYVDGALPAPQSGTITIYNLTPGGSYTVEWWHTSRTTQQVLGSEVLAAQADGSVLINVTDLENDIAIKLRPMLDLDPQVWMPLITS